MSADLDSYLRPAGDEDLDRLHRLASLREVYFYLADDRCPTCDATLAWIEASHQSFGACGVGLWLLEAGQGELAGFVLLEPELAERSAELTYALAPGFRGRGLATRMSRTAIGRAFASGQIDQVVAGADEPNTASLQVMERLGMSFLRKLQYPCHPGVETVCRRVDWRGAGAGDELPIR